MLITCPHCSAEHEVPEDFLGAAGRKVRCRSCREIWHADPTLPEQVAAAEADAVAPPAEPAPETATVEVLPPETPAEIVSDQVQPAAPVPRRPARPRNAGGSRRRATANPRPRMLRVGFVAAAVVVAATLLIALRAPIVRAAPQTARLYAALAMPVNLRGLDIGSFASHVYTENGGRLLVVEGAVTNVTRQPRPVPPLRFAVRDGKGAELYVWTAKLDKSEIAAGETLPFRKRLAAPPPEGRNVEVRFIDDNEQAAALTAREGGDRPRS
jgi:predicted Zn finger-like uncharacterized protein